MIWEALRDELVGDVGAMIGSGLRREMIRDLEELGLWIEAQRWGGDYEGPMGLVLDGVRIGG